MAWKTGRGLLGPIKPLLGHWITQSSTHDSGLGMRCERFFTLFGKGWVKLEAKWQLGERGTYSEIAFFGPVPDGNFGFYSYTNDGKRSEGHIGDATDIHSQAIGFEAQMPAGRARFAYWPDEDANGFYFAVENATKKGWKRFLKQHYRRVDTPDHVD